MFYTPKFCCNCGEKIERVDWKLWTSRRFCDVCAIEKQGYELLPKAIVGVALLFGIFGIGSNLHEKSPASQSVPNTVAGLKRADDESKRQPIQPDPGNSEVGNKAQVIEPPTADNKALKASKEQPKIRGAASDEAVFFCGSMTKKGKPCSRRVKVVNERCWQHAGQPLAAPAPKVTEAF